MVRGIRLRIDYGDGRVEEWRAEELLGTSLELLATAKPTYSISKCFGCDPAMGSFIESIGMKRSTKNTYWLVYVNGKLSDVGIDEIKLRDYDLLELRFRPVGFGRSGSGHYGKI